MSIKVSTRVWENSKHKGSDLLALLAIADHADDDGVAWPGIPRVAFKSRVSVRQAKRIVQKLTESGEVYVETGGGRGYANLYFVAVGLDEDEIEDVLVRRFELKAAEAELVAHNLVKTQKGDTDVTFSKKGDTGDTVSRQKGDTQGKRVTSRAKKGDTAMSPEPSYNHHESIKEKEEPSDPRAMFAALANACCYNLNTITDTQRKQLGQSAKILRKAGATPELLDEFAQWWPTHDWRGKKNGESPEPAQVREEWGRFTAWREKNRPASSLTLASHDPDPLASWWRQSVLPLLIAYRANLSGVEPLDQANGTLTLRAASPQQAEMLKQRLSGPLLRAVRETRPDIGEIEYE